MRDYKTHTILLEHHPSSYLHPNTTLLEHHPSSYLHPNTSKQSLCVTVAEARHHPILMLLRLTKLNVSSAFCLSAYRPSSHSYSDTQLHIVLMIQKQE
jgi:hypothetical protein